MNNEIRQYRRFFEKVGQKPKHLFYDKMGQSEQQKEEASKLPKTQKELEEDFYKNKTN